MGLPSASVKCVRVLKITDTNEAFCMSHTFFLNFVDIYIFTKFLNFITNNSFVDSAVVVTAIKRIITTEPCNFTTPKTNYFSTLVCQFYRRNYPRNSMGLCLHHHIDWCTCCITSEPAGAMNHIL